MKWDHHFGRRRGFTLIDFLIVVVTLCLAVLALPYVASRGCKARSSRISCVSNLKQIGLAYRMWANDHGERLPMEVPFAERRSERVCPGW